MVRPALPYAALASVALLLSGCTIHTAPPTVTFWNKLGIPQAGNAMNANLINRKGNHPQWEKKPPLKRIADPLNFESPNPAIKAAAEIKAEEDLAPQKIKALKYLATIGCGCYDKEGKVEAAILAGLNDCTEEVRLTAAETVLELTSNCGACGCCYTSCCTEKIQEKLQDMAYGEKEGCWHEPSAEVRAVAMRALAACPPIDVSPIEPSVERETVPTPPVPGPRETAPEPAVPGEPLPPIPPPAPLETSVPTGGQTAPFWQEEAEQVKLTSTPASPTRGAFYAPINVGAVGSASGDISTVSAEESTTSAVIVINDDTDEVIIPGMAAQATATQGNTAESIHLQTNIEFVLERQNEAVMHLPKSANVSSGEVLGIQIHSRRGEHTIEGKVTVVKVNGSLVHVRPIDGLALRTMRPGSPISIAR